MSETERYADALRWAGQQLESMAQANPRLEAEVLLAHLLGRPRSHLLAWPERALEPQRQRDFRALVAQRLAGTPLAYLTGRREFWSLELAVSPAVLIPRPDSELLVELALGRIPAGAPWRVADLGTGSGAIAAAIASERPHCQVLASDHSAAALELARENFRRLGLGRVETRLGDWCAVFQPGERFELILSNPPYIAEGDPHLGQGDLPAEPPSALVSGPDGLDDLRRLCRRAPAFLRPGGWLLLEHGLEQGARVRALLRTGGLGQVASHLDLEGRERVSLGSRA